MFLFAVLLVSLRSVEGSGSYDHCKEGFACLTSDAAVRMGAGVRFLGHCRTRCLTLFYVLIMAM